MSYSRYDRDDPVSTVIAFGLAIVLAAGAAYCGREPKTEVDRKPPIVNVLKERARRRCRDGNEDGAELPQEQRLTLVLENVKSKDLDVLVNKNITVCPDSRLAHQDTGLFDRTLRGVYYRADGVVSLYDNGRTADKFWDADITDRGAEMVRKIADEISSDTSPSENLYAGFYTRSCGRRCTRTYADWRKAGGWGGFDSDTLSKNQQIVRQAPVVDNGWSVER